MGEQRAFTIPGYVVKVGWDPPMQTFFAQSFRTDVSHGRKCKSDSEHVPVEPDDVCICDLNPEIWIGASRHAEIPTVEVLQALMGATKIPEDIVRELREDRVANR